MDIKMIESMANQGEQDFTNEEISIFKRYLEENIVCNNNNFEFIEENLGYYASRYTRGEFFSPAELFLINANYIHSIEMATNYDLYEKSVEWFSKTVHPEDSEYVIKQEKYVFNDDLQSNHKSLIEYLNKYSKQDYQCVDLLIYINGDIYKYLPQKNFIFRWRKNCKYLLEKMVKNNFYQLNSNLTELDLNKSMIIFPIFVPIRQSVFIGEFGFKTAMLEYGMVVERITSYLQGLGGVYNLRRFDNHDLNNALGLDGVEKSIFNIILFN